MIHVSEMVTNFACMECSNLSRWDFFYRTLCMLHNTRTKAGHSVTLKPWFQPLLHESFRKYDCGVSQFLLYWMRIICCIYKDFVRQLKAFFPSFCLSHACEMSPGWGHLITWMDPSVGHLNGILARVGGNLNNNFQKSNACGGGGDVEASIWTIHYIRQTLSCSNHSMCLVVLFLIVNHCKSTHSLIASYKVIQKWYTSP